MKIAAWGVPLVVSSQYGRGRQCFHGLRKICKFEIGHVLVFMALRTN